MYSCPVCFDADKDSIVPAGEHWQIIDGVKTPLDEKESFIVHLLGHLAEIQAGELVLARV